MKLTSVLSQTICSFAALNYRQKNVLLNEKYNVMHGSDSFHCTCNKRNSVWNKLHAYTYIVRYRPKLSEYCIVLQTAYTLSFLVVIQDVRLECPVGRNLPEAELKCGMGAIHLHLHEAPSHHVGEHKSQSNSRIMASPVRSVAELAGYETSDHSLAFESVNTRNPVQNCYLESTFLKNTIHAEISNGISTHILKATLLNARLWLEIFSVLLVLLIISQQCYYVLSSIILWSTQILELKEGLYCS
jgi:hypothetical protein